MKKIIVIIVLSLVVFILFVTTMRLPLWVALFQHSRYYYIPESETYVRIKGKVVFVSDKLGQLTDSAAEHGWIVTGVTIRNSFNDAQLLLPLKEPRIIIIDDPHNCTYKEQIRTKEILFLPLDKSTIKLPPCVSISLKSFKKNGVYSLPDGSLHTAILLCEETVNTTDPKDAMIYSDPNRAKQTIQDILVMFDKQSITKKKPFFSQDTTDGVIKLHIGENIIDCICDKYGAYPSFFYNPYYPNIIFSDNYGQITFRKCKDLSVINESRLQSALSMDDGWYRIDFSL